MLDTIFLFAGVILSLGLIFMAYLIKHKSHALRADITSFGIENAEEIHIEDDEESSVVVELSKHFQDLPILKVNADADLLKLKFEKELKRKFIRQNIVMESYKKEQFKASMKKVHFEPNIIQYFNDVGPKTYVKEYATIYATIAEIIIICHSIKVVEKKLKISSSEHSYKLKDYNVNVRENEKGLESISVNNSITAANSGLAQ